MIRSLVPDSVTVADISTVSMADLVVVAVPKEFYTNLPLHLLKGKVVVESQDWATSMGFKLPGGVTLPPDLDIKREGGF